jgi:hypothetical protein
MFLIGNFGTSTVQALLNVYSKTFSAIIKEFNTVAVSAFTSRERKPINIFRRRMHSELLAFWTLSIVRYSRN